MTHTNDNRRRRRTSPAPGPAARSATQGRGDDLNRSVGNKALSRAIQKSASHGGRGHTTVQRDEEVTFSDDEGSVTARLNRDEVDEELRDIHDLMGREFEIFFNSWATGLENFLTTMQFESAQEAEPDYMGAMIQSVAKSLIGAGFSQISAIPVVGSIAGPILKGAFDLGIAAYDEEQRAAAAGRERDLASYVTQMRTAIGQGKDQTTRAHVDFFPTVLAELRQRSGNEVTEERPGAGAWVHEDVARFISSYRQTALAFRDYTPSRALFQQRITERYAMRGGMVGLVTRDTWRPSGTLTIGVRATETNGVLQLDEIDDSWVLGTSGANPQRVAQNLMDSLRGPVFTHAELPRRIHISIEVAEPGINREFEGTIFISPNAPPMIRHGSSERARFERALRHPGIGVALVEADRIAGSSR